MGKSQESWNKKEVRNKKEKKRKDKEKKRLERKAGVKKSLNLDDMLAYVDENGNITSSPPDPDKKKNIKAEDIEIGIPKRTSAEEFNPVRKGIVTFFNESKGYGFIKDLDTQKSIFVHVDGLVDQIKKDNIVSFEIALGKRGPIAVNVKLEK